MRGPTPPVLFSQYTKPKTARIAARTKAPIKTATRVDIPHPYGDQPPGKTVVGGVAWAQGRGISKVEIQVDDTKTGEIIVPWQAATLTPWSNKDTWRQWKFEWDAPRVHHTYNIAARAYDLSGAVQTDKVMQSIPDGASGYHNALTTVVLT